MTRENAASDLRGWVISGDSKATSNVQIEFEEEESHGKRKNAGTDCGTGF